jgi:redox-sensitive bicupin YhaK (pirin superfamily)
VLRGRVEANGVALAAGDGAAVREEDRLEVVANGEAEVLLFDLA